MYRWYAPPWEILRQLPEVARHLQPDLTIAARNEVAGVESDTAGARRMHAAKRKLYAGKGQKQSA
jgi:hypothetical protein